MIKNHQNQRARQALLRAPINYASQQMPSNYSSRPNNQKKKLSFGKKVLIGSGAAGLLGSLGLIYVGKKLKDWFFPPTFKRYLATGMFIFSLYAIRNCSEVKGGIVSVYNDMKSGFVSDIERRKDISPYKKEIDNLSKDNKQLSRVIEEKNALLEKKNERQAGIGDVLDYNVNNSAGLENKLSKNNKSYNSTRANNTITFNSYSAQSMPGSVKSIEEIIKKYNGDYKHVIYVNKLDQILSIYDLDSKQAVLFKSFKCITGKNPEPKTKEGDLATPEGVYIINKTDMGLEGNPLFGFGFLGVNYPNSQDKQRKLTGGGIGISGTGMEERVEAISKSKASTNGCASMQNNDMIELYSHIKYEVDKTLVVFENPQRPLRFRGMIINE